MMPSVTTTMKPPAQVFLRPMKSRKAPMSPSRLREPIRNSHINSGTAQISSATVTAIRNAPPPHSAATRGKRQMLPVPTAIETAAMMIAMRPVHCSCCGCAICGTLISSKRRVYTALPAEVHRPASPLSAGMPPGARNAAFTRRYNERRTSTRKLSIMKKLEFRNGDTVDAIGLGTWKSDPGEVGHAVEAALEAGYRHIDCAAIYRNEAEVGEALQRVFARGDIKRDDVHVTSKLWNNAHLKGDVEPALKKTLSDLKLEYLDLYLIHWPVAFRPGLEGFPESESDFLTPDQAPIDETWAAMLDVRDKGLTRHVGVSNFSTRKLDELAASSDERPEMNQVELHPYLQQKELLAYCRENGILVTAYSPLGSSDRPEEMKDEDEPSLLENDVIGSIAEKHGASPAQVLIAWAVSRDTIVIPKSTNPDHIRKNLESANIELDGQDMQRIRDLDQHYRYIGGDSFRTESGLYANIFDD